MLRFEFEKPDFQLVVSSCCCPTYSNLQNVLVIKKNLLPHMFTPLVFHSIMFSILKLNTKKIEKLSSEIQICALKKQEIYKKKKNKDKTMIMIS